MHTLERTSTYPMPMHSFSPVFFACAITFTSLAPAQSNADAAETAALPAKVAQIGGAVITGAEFQRDLTYRWRMLELQLGRHVEPDRKFRLDTLNELVNARVLRILARRAGIVVTDAEVAADFETRRKAMGDQQALEAYLAQLGLAQAALMQEIRARIQTEKYVEGRTQAITIDEEDLKADFERLKASAPLQRTTKTVDFAHILIRAQAGDAGGQASARERIDAARERITAGEAFWEVAQAVSEDAQSSEFGGVYREAKMGTVPEEIAARMYGLGIGELSDPFQSSQGWHLLTVLEVHAPGDYAFEDLREQLHARRFAAEKQKVLADLVKAAKEDLKIEIFEAAAAGVLLEERPH